MRESDAREMLITFVRLDPFRGQGNRDPDAHQARRAIEYVVRVCGRAEHRERYFADAVTPLATLHMHMHMHLHALICSAEN